MAKSHFHEIKKFKADFFPAEITLYESQRSGMRVVTVDQKGPKVYGYFTLATEIHDDSGSPHTLEHLVFMGSKNYKFKGLLDQLATRAYSYTNAWTATDHTAYTLETAGWDGFVQILPIYLEHLLFPTLTDAGCYTEVHHIDGSGNDAGVVYSEMQGVQNQQRELMDLKARRLIYPKNSGFRSETGGLMEQLRVLTAERIRGFHRDMYQPRNLCLVIAGEINQPSLIKVLDDFEESIKDDIPRLDKPFERPWTRSGKTPALERSVVEKVEFPEEDESMGEISITYLGPDLNDELDCYAMGALLIYLCGSTVSLLGNTLVEKEQLCSGVYFYTDSRPDVAIYFTLTGVETKKLELVEKRFLEVLKTAVDNPLDMEYMRDCVHRYRRQVKFYSESSGSAHAETVIADYLFGKRDGSTLLTMGTLKTMDELETWNEQSWKQFLSRWIVDANHVSILGVPSSTLSKKIKEDEDARVKAVREKLGEDGLKKLANKLEEAKAQNDIEIPKELLQQFKTPGTESISFLSTVTARSGLARDMGKLDNKIQEIIDKDKSDSKLFIHFEHITSNFVQLNLILCTHSVPVELRPLLPVYLANFFDTPIKRNNVRLEFEDVVTQLERDTVSYSIDTGSGVDNSELLRIRFQVEPEKYEAAIKWIKEFLYASIFDTERLKSTLAKILADVPEEKRSGNSMAAAVVVMSHYSRESTARVQNTLVKTVCLRRALALLKKDPQTLIDKLEKIRTALTSPANFRVLVLADLESSVISRPVSAWEHLTSSLDQKNSESKPLLNPLDSRLASLSEEGRHPGKLAYIVPMSTIDSSYALLVTSAPTSYMDPSLPALSITLAYLDVTEGPLWKAVRGTGLAYGFGFTEAIDTGRLQYRIYRSPDAHKAFVASRKVVQDLADGTVELDEIALEGALSSVVVAVVDEQTTMADAAVVSFANQVVKGVPKEFGLEFVKAARNVTSADVKKCLKEMVLPFFQPGAADLVVTCAKIMEQKLVDGFSAEGFATQVQPLSYFEDDYDMEGAELVEELGLDADSSEEEDGDSEGSENDDSEHDE